MYDCHTPDFYHPERDYISIFTPFLGPSTYVANKKEKQNNKMESATKLSNRLFNDALLYNWLNLTTIQIGRINPHKFTSNYARIFNQ